VRIGEFLARVTEVDGMRICRVLLTRVEPQVAEGNGTEEAEAVERVENNRDR
jgi:hypothetical protein